MNNVFSFEEFNLIGEDFFNELEKDHDLYKKEIDQIMQEPLDEGVKKDAFKMMMSKMDDLLKSSKNALRNLAEKIAKKKDAVTGDSKFLRNLNKLKNTEDKKIRRQFANKASGMLKSGEYKKLTPKQQRKLAKKYAQLSGKDRRIVIRSSVKSDVKDAKGFGGMAKAHRKGQAIDRAGGDLAKAAS